MSKVTAIVHVMDSETGLVLQILWLPLSETGHRIAAVTGWKDVDDLKRMIGAGSTPVYWAHSGRRALGEGIQEVRQASNCGAAPPPGDGSP